MRVTMEARRGTAAAPGALDHGMRRDVGTLALLFTSVGSIIGSGWLFGAHRAAVEAGPAAVVSWALGGVMIILIALTYAELGTMFPVSGGVVRFPHYAFGGFASYVAGWVTWLAAASVAPIEVEAALQYGTNYVPWLTHVADGVPVLSPGGYVAAVLLMALFCVINLFGVRWFARANTVVVWWKLAIITLVVVVLLAARFVPAHFTAYGGFVPQGWHGVFSAIATSGIVFSYLGFRQGVELAGESSDPRRAVPIAVVGSVVLCMLLYVGLQVAFIGALPERALAGGWARLSYANDFGPLAGLATLLGLSWLAALLYADAIISPADAGLIYLTVTARLSYAMGKNRTAPAVLARLDRRGVPWTSLILAFLVGLVFFLPFPGWQKLVGFITSATVLSFGSGPLVLGAMRRELPAQPRPFRLAGGDLVPLLAFWASNLIVYWTGWSTNAKLFLAIVLGLLVLAAQQASPRRRFALDWRAGSWVWAWLIGLVVLSYLGPYGGTGTIGFGAGLAWTAVLTVVVYAWAMRVRFSGARMIDAIAHEARDLEAAL
jgi:amino acid transporter